MKRSEQRENIFLLLYQKDFHSEEELDTQIENHFDSMVEEQNVKNSDREYITDKLKKIISKLPEIDTDIDKKTVGWNISRIGKVELAILRLAYYEIMFDDAVPQNVAIDEAVELAKKYGADDSFKFVNGVLANLVKKDD